jgi:rubrerythrin
VTAAREACRRILRETAMSHWTLQDIPWDRFEPARVAPDILRVVKAAAMVEKNSADYATYLGNVFPDDPEFVAAARAWAEEEVQHGDALGRWAEMADPQFRFAERFEVFRRGFRIPVDSRESVRGSRSGELVARCVVEVGTSSYYTALGEATDEPVLKAICARIAADEFRHYKMFYTYLRRYVAHERPSPWHRLAVALGRIVESDDDELAYAYYAANNQGEPYDRRRCADAYAARAYRVYRPRVIERGVAMTLKAAGFRPYGRHSRILSGLARGVMGWRARRLAA